MVDLLVHAAIRCWPWDASAIRGLKLLAESYSLTMISMPGIAPANSIGPAAIVFDAIAYTSNLEKYPDTLGRLAASGQIMELARGQSNPVRSWEPLVC